MEDTSSSLGAVVTSEVWYLANRPAHSLAPRARGFLFCNQADATDDDAIPRCKGLIPDGLLGSNSRVGLHLGGWRTRSLSHLPDEPACAAWDIRRVLVRLNAQCSARDKRGVSRACRTQRKLRGYFQDG